jgi:aminoglycoside phosphotransferase (APT) family kinase protein
MAASMAASDAVSEVRRDLFDDPARRAVLDRYRVDVHDHLGHGGEADVFALDAERVLRVHRNPDHHGSARYVRSIGAFYDSLDRGAVPFALPQVLEVHEEDVTWSIERRLPGRPLDAMLDELSGEERRRAIGSYVDGAAAFGALGVPDGFEGGFGELFTAERLVAPTWGELLAERLALQLERGEPVVRDLVPDLGRARTRVLAMARAEPADGRTLVHGDFFPGNVLFGDDLGVSAVLDLGWLTVVGDPTHDIRSAVAFWSVRPWSKPGDREALVAAAQRHLGDDTLGMLQRTERFEQARFAFVAEDPHLFAWCLDGLRSLAAGGGGTVPGDGS